MHKLHPGIPMDWIAQDALLRASRHCRPLEPSVWLLSAAMVPCQLHVHCPARADKAANVIAGKPDPAWYYEPVQPSDWKPPKADTCIELYRRAYCGIADVVFPLLWLGILAVLCWGQWLPLWGIVLVGLPLFVGGVQLFIVSGKSCVCTCA